MFLKSFYFLKIRKKIDEVLDFFSVLGVDTDYERLVVKGAEKIRQHLLVNGDKK